VTAYERSLVEAWEQAQAPRAPGAPTVITTFAGMGGSSLGYKMAGFDVRLAAEWDEEAVETYRLNFPKTPVFHGDVTNLSVEQALELAQLQPGQLDVLDGSPPCQGFSTSGGRSLDDERNQLFRQYVRLLEGLTPKAFVMENVSGMVKGKMRGTFVEILQALKAAGYFVSARLLNAMYLGVPQARERMIFVGVRKDLGVQPAHPAPWSRPITVAQALEGVVNDPKELALLFEAGKKYTHWERVRPGSSVKYDVTGYSGFNSIKIHPGRPSPTIGKSTSILNMFHVTHWSERRKFTMVEYQRLFGIPEGYQWPARGGLAEAWSNAVARMGNCVPPLLTRAVAETVRRIIAQPGKMAGDEDQPA
jgi:DNA (cytosine-5)-methyltransferase 1